MGLSCAWALEHGLNSSGSQALLLCHLWDPPDFRDQIPSPAFGRWILIHCTIKEVPTVFSMLLPRKILKLLTLLGRHRGKLPRRPDVGARTW